MWIFTSNGMLSVVAHREKKCSLLVRARSPIHIQGLFPGLAVSETPDADYPYRVVVPRQQFAKVVLDYAMNIDYDNFKNSIEENFYRAHCVDIWAVMMRYGLNWGRFE